MSQIVKKNTKKNKNLKNSFFFKLEEKNSAEKKLSF